MIKNLKTHLPIMNIDLTMADVSLLQLLTGIGPHTFPLVTNQSDDQAIIHAERMVLRGLVVRQVAKSGLGPTYEVTEAGLSAIKEYESL